ncbi:spore germination protein [Aureibacillus halotolerans]|uniref:Stage V sporulation protein AF n=1 Tax=Aureibacillus halotolerans TaxID=1508390 RepID=A0A4R6UES3_9BACI|nr:spore germination protein [Aureibacillus halotolerans]TDQ41594.1 stage V sporulation protein AF [Aureibacillus halotolerans]
MAKETKTKTKTPISTNIKEVESYFKHHLGMDVSFDVGVRRLLVLDKQVHIYYVTGLCESRLIAEIIEELVHLNEVEKSDSDVAEVVHNRLLHQQVATCKTYDEACDQVLSGLIFIAIDGENRGFIVDVRKYPGRSPKEPDTEKVVRGSRDGYTENIIENTALTRRRIRDERLRFKMVHVGERSKTDICIVYLQDVADEELVDLIGKQLDKIDIDGLPMSDKTVEEFVVKQGYNPFPLVRYTERPDVASSHLLEGHVLIFVDTSPSVIITPTTFFHHVQHAEEFRQAPLMGAFYRWVRFLGMIAALFLTPLWFLFVVEPSLLAEQLGFIGPDKETNIPIVAQLLLADFGIDLMRMAAIHTPTSLSTAMGLIAAVLIGQIAIEVGLFTNEVILYVAVAAIGSFATPSYELSIANKVARLLFIISVFFFQVPGFVIAVTVFVLFLVSITSLQTPYLWPLLPFNAKAFWHVLMRVSVPLANTRPSIVKPRNRKSQPGK